jgi:hypothetical protein
MKGFVVLACVCLLIALGYSAITSAVNLSAGLNRPDEGAIGLALGVRENNLTQFEIDGAVSLSEAEKNLAMGYAAQVEATAALEQAGNGRMIAIAIFFLALALVIVGRMAA